MILAKSRGSAISDPQLEVLKIATHNGAKSLGILDDVGTVAVGKRADLILLREDPSKDISATRTIERVMQGGRLLDSAVLLSGGSPGSG